MNNLIESIKQAIHNRGEKLETLWREGHLCMLIICQAVTALVLFLPAIKQSRYKLRLVARIISSIKIGMHHRDSGN